MVKQLICSNSKLDTFIFRIPNGTFFKLHINKFLHFHKKLNFRSIAINWINFISFVQFNKYILRAYYAPGTQTGGEYQNMDRIEPLP